MISLERVMQILVEITGLKEVELEPYFLIISNAVNVTSMEIDEACHKQDRVIHYAAAKANYAISLVKDDDGISSFSAGDVSITKNNQNNSAKRFLEEAEKSVSDIIVDKGFAFLGV